jgi:hypothetical protein
VSDASQIWQPPLIEWAIRTLPRYLPEEERGELGDAQLAWQRRQLEALGAFGPTRRVAVLGEIERIAWLSELEHEADALQQELLADASLDELFEISDLVLESGLLRLVEQNEQSVDETLTLFAQELSCLRRVRHELRKRPAQAREQDCEARYRQMQRRLASLERRLLNQTDEAVLHRRLERFFGERNVRWFSRVSLTALLGLLVLILVDLIVPPSGWWATFVFWADTGICFLFLWEFLVRFVLAPRRHVWFFRHFLTDFVPAIPFALLLHPGPGSAQSAAGAELLVRSVRLVRVPVYVRSLRFLKPAVAAFRLLIYGVRGLDRLVNGLAPVLNREIVFFEREDRPPELEHNTRGAEATITQRFMRLSPKKRSEAAPALFAKLQAQLGLYERDRDRLQPFLEDRQVQASGASIVPVEDAIEGLRGLTAEQVEEKLPADIVRSLGRLLRAFQLPIVRYLPLLGRLVRRVQGNTPGERVASAGRLIGGHFQQVLSVIHGWADLAGVVTAPQVLDRVGSALAKSTQRPAVRLILFGSLFVLARLVIEGLLGIELGEGFKSFLQRFVVGPILIVGIGALVLLLVARWLKRIAGEATERLERLSEARFANLMELVHRKNEEDDRCELVHRVHRSRGAEMFEERVEIAMAMEELRGRLPEGQISQVSHRARRLALLLLDAQDGGFLHSTNQKTTEQFLAHPDLWILRQKHLGLRRREQKRLQRLDLENGGLFSGPHFWFEQITHSVSIKVARLCSTYNMHALPLEARDAASEEDLERHRMLIEGSEELEAEPSDGVSYKTSFFHVLHFLTPGPDLARRGRAQLWQGAACSAARGSAAADPRHLWHQAAARAAARSAQLQSLSLLYGASERRAFLAAAVQAAVCLAAAHLRARQGRGQIRARDPRPQEGERRTQPLRGSLRRRTAQAATHEEAAALRGDAPAGPHRSALSGAGCRRRARGWRLDRA